ncbi:hypothetical protein LZC95_12380 [Pendulispora brunnea]|uniref:LytR/CpsA/Psr regulator C-terminal domain-containing protein n=1 Tax=Pendulispora brunnea TaxID=2905690 RepID=A0ABZ2KJY1_9BACT
MPFKPSKLGIPKSDPPKPDIEALAASVDRVGKIQLLIVGLLTLALVAIPLYLWRRPRSEDNAPPIPRPVVADAVGETADAAAPTALDAGASGISLSEIAVLSCHDRGTRKTAPGDCDRLSSIETALAAAIVKKADCVPTSSAGGTIQYVADVGFARTRNKIAILAPRDGRTLKSAKLASACALAVKKELASTPLDIPHAHERYKIVVTANYAGR